MTAIKTTAIIAQNLIVSNSPLDMIGFPSPPFRATDRPDFSGAHSYFRKFRKCFDTDHMLHVHKGTSY